MKRILVVDDDAASGELLEEIFAAQGWHSLTAQTPQRARELAEQQPFDLVVSDINLEAEESGLDLCAFAQGLSGNSGDRLRSWKRRLKRRARVHMTLSRNRSGRGSGGRRRRVGARQEIDGTGADYEPIKAPCKTKSPDALQR